MVDGNHEQTFGHDIIVSGFFQLQFERHLVCSCLAVVLLAAITSGLPLHVFKPLIWPLRPMLIFVLRYTPSNNERARGSLSVHYHSNFGRCFFRQNRH